MSLIENHLLLALASGPLHGYAIAEHVAAESGALSYSTPSVAVIT